MEPSKEPFEPSFLKSVRKRFVQNCNGNLAIVNLSSALCVVSYILIRILFMMVSLVCLPTDLGTVSTKTFLPAAGIFFDCFQQKRHVLENCSSCFFFHAQRHCLAGHPELKTAQVRVDRSAHMCLQLAFQILTAHLSCLKGVIQCILLHMIEEKWI